jgi:hypothetical protein
LSANPISSLALARQNIQLLHISFRPTIHRRAPTQIRPASAAPSEYIRHKYSRRRVRSACRSARIPKASVGIGRGFAAAKVWHPHHRPNLVNSRSFTAAVPYLVRRHALYMDPCALFLMEDSSFYDDSNLEELLGDDIEQTTIILSAKEILDVKPKNRQRLSMGLMCIPLNRARGHNMLMRDYFAEVPTYPPHLFCHRYRMRRSLFNKIFDACESNTCYFKRKRNTVGLIGFSTHQKISVIMRILAYGIPADYADEYLHIGEDTTTESIRQFCKVMIRSYGLTYLRSPNEEDTIRLMA